MFYGKDERNDSLLKLVGGTEEVCESDGSWQCEKVIMNVAYAANW